MGIRSFIASLFCLKKQQPPTPTPAAKTNRVRHTEKKARAFHDQVTAYASMDPSDSGIDWPSADNPSSPTVTPVKYDPPAKYQQRNMIPRRPVPQRAATVHYRPTTEPMNTAILQEVITLVARSFGHLSYAIFGLAAMVEYGFDERLPSGVMVLLPLAARDVVRCWAVSQGMRPVSANPDDFGVVVSDGTVRVVKLAYTDTDSHNALDIEANSVLMAVSTSDYARVASLQMLANQLAREYVDDLAILTVEGQYALAADVRWVLVQMAGYGMRFDYANAANILSRDFWMPFTLSFPDMLGLFRDVGIAPPQTARQDDWDLALPEIVPLRTTRLTDSRAARATRGTRRVRDAGSSLPQRDALTDRYSIATNF